MTTPTGLKMLDETSDKDSEDGVTNIVYKEIFRDVRVIEVIPNICLIHQYRPDFVYRN